MRADCLAWVEEMAAARREFDVIYIDPPTFSNSKAMQQSFDVQRDHATLIETESNDKFVFLINREDSFTVADMELRLPDGRYEVRARDENGWYQALVGGKRAVSRAELRTFRLTMEPLKPYVLHIRSVAATDR